MKPGAADPFDEEADDEAATEEKEEVDETIDEATTAQTENLASESVSTDTVTTSGQELPYLYRRDTIQDGRQRANLFLRDKAESHVEGLIEEMNAVFESETVYKFDVLEAGLLAAGSDSTVEDELRKMGYGMK